MGLITSITLRILDPVGDRVLAAHLQIILAEGHRESDPSGHGYEVMNATRSTSKVTSTSCRTTVHRLGPQVSNLVTGEHQVV